MRDRLERNEMLNVLLLEWITILTFTVTAGV